MPSAIHQILLKKLNETSVVLLGIDVWSNRQMSSYIGVSIHLFQIKATQSYADLQTIVTCT